MDGLVGYASGDSENSPSPSPNPPPPQLPKALPKAKAMEPKDANLMEEWQSFEKLIGADMKSHEAANGQKKAREHLRSRSSSGSSRSRSHSRSHSRSRSKSSASSHSSSSRSRSNSPSRKSKLKKSRSSSSSSSESESVLPTVANGLPNPLPGSQDIPDKPVSKYSDSCDGSDEEPEIVKTNLGSKSPPVTVTCVEKVKSHSRSRSRSPHRRRRSRSRDRRRRRSGSRSRRRRGRRRSRSRHRSRSGDRKGDKADGEKQSGDLHERRRSRSHDRRRRHGRRRSRSRSRDRRRKRRRSERSWRRAHRKRRRSADHKKRSRSRSKSPIHKKKNEPMTFKEKLKQSLLEVQKQAAAGEKPATDKLTPAQIAAMSGGQVTPQQALLQTMAAMHQKAQELTGVAVPKYYNPAAVNPLKYAEQVQKRKLLWSKKTPATPAPATAGSAMQPGTSAAGSLSGHPDDPHHQNHMFLNDADGKTAEKFRKLMGIKGENAEKTVYTNDEMVKKQDELFDNLDKEYAFARMATHTHRGVGLGFTSQVYFPK